MTTHTTKRIPGTPTWMDLATPDLDVAKAFYTELFGWDYFDTGEDFGNYNMALSDGRNAAGIGPIFPPDSPQPSAWTIYLASDDIKADVKRIQDLGGQVVMEPMEVSDSGSMAICSDPTGAVFGLWEANTHIGAGVENEHGGMCWFEVNTNDSEAARAFYSELTNTTPVAMEDADYYHIMNRGEDMLYGVLQMNEEWAGIPPHWMGYFTVDNTDATCEKAVAAGGKVAVPAFDMDYGRMAVLTDPAGATFSIVQPPAA